MSRRVIGTHDAADSASPKQHLRLVTDENVAVNFDDTPSRGSTHDLKNVEADIPAPKPSRREPTSLDIAFDALLALLASHRTGLEKSNAFDEWRERVSILADHALDRDIPMRQVVGLLLVATKGLEATDLSPAHIAALVDCTNSLRRGRVTTIDVNNAIRVLTASGLSTIIREESIDDDELDSLIDAARGQR